MDYFLSEANGRREACWIPREICSKTSTKLSISTIIQLLDLGLYLNIFVQTLYLARNDSEVLVRDGIVMLLPLYRDTLDKAQFNKVLVKLYDDMGWSLEEQQQETLQTLRTSFKKLFTRPEK